MNYFLKPTEPPYRLSVVMLYTVFESTCFFCFFSRHFERDRDNVQQKVEMSQKL